MPRLLGLLLALLVTASSGPAQSPAYHAAFGPGPGPTVGYTVDDGAGDLSWIFAFDDQVRPFFWGTLAAGPDSGTRLTRLHSQGFTSDAPFLLVPALGNRHGEIRVRLHVDGRPWPVAPESFRVASPPEVPFFLGWDLREHAPPPGAVLTVVADDSSPRDWIGLGAPHRLAGREAALDQVDLWAELYRNDYTYAWRVVRVTLALLGLPLLVSGWARRFGRAFWLALGGGLLAWSALGLALWLAGPDPVRPWATALHHTTIAAALIGATLWLCRLRQPGRALWIGVFGLYAVVVTQAHLLTIIDVPVKGELGRDTLLRGRMVAAPPDNIIPFLTAIYLYHGKDGRESREVYFGADWSITSRGPLFPLVIGALFLPLEVKPHDPAYPAERRWPADDEGMHIARAVGIALNALGLLAVATATAAWTGGDRRRVLLAAALMALAPFAAASVVFVWPKLFAAGAFVLALTLVKTGDRRLWPAVTAIGYYAHPLVALLFPALVVFAWLQEKPRTGRELARLGLTRAVVFVALLVPWLLYKRWVGFPDVMLGYVLGDGRGFHAAASVGGWLGTRWDNFAHTFVPFHWWFVHPPFWWFNDWIDGWARWAFYGTKALPAQLGLVFGLALAGGLVRARGDRRLLLVLGVMSLALLVFWGYSREGLGRHCLDPVTAIAVVWLAAWLPIRRRPAALALAALVLERLGMIVGSFDWDGVRTWDLFVRHDLALLAVLLALLLVAPVGFVIGAGSDAAPAKDPSQP